LEIDPQVVPGEKNDTINARLRFFANRAEGEEIVNDNIYGTSRNPTSFFAFDLEGAAERYGIPAITIDGSITYILKISYDSYKWDGYYDVDESVVTKKYMTIQWTPGNPYGVVED